MRYGVIDIGSSGVKLSIYDRDLKCVLLEKVAIPLSTTPEGFVEHDSRAIRSAFLSFIKRLREAGVKLAGVATYRASILAWNKEGDPLTNVITWLDPRGKAVASRPFYRALRALPILSKVLRPDSPAIRIKWLLESNEGIKRRVEEGEAFVGTLSSYVAYLISRRYVNDLTNEALTGLIHPRTLKRLDVVYSLLRIPRAVDPEIVDNVGYIGSIDGVDVVSLIADQQAAIVGSSCLDKSCLKITGGTGVFIDAVVDKFTIPGGGLIPLVVYKIGPDRLYAIEGFTVGGYVVEWLAKLGLIPSVDALDDAVSRAERSPVFIPSLLDIGLPVKRCGGSGLIYGLSTSHSKEDLVRGALEGLVCTIGSVVDIVEKAAGRRSVVRADGGLSNSSYYLKLLSTLCGRRVERIRGSYATGRGVAMLEALYEGSLRLSDLAKMPDVDVIVEPGEAKVKVDYGAWRRALRWG